MIETEKKLSLSDLIDINFLQELQDAFAKTMNVASLTYDENGPVTRPSNFTEFCTKYTRTSKEGAKRCTDCDVLWGNLATKKGKPIVYTCHAGLTDFVVPIIVGGEHIGSIYGGQILTHPPDEDAFREIARQIDVNEDEYIEALRKIKIISIDKVNEAAHFLSLVANAISEISLKNYELMEKNEKDSLYNSIIETVRSSLDIEEIKQKVINIVGKTLKADRCFIAEFDSLTDKYLIVNNEYLSSESILPFKGADVNIEVPVFAEAVKQGKPLIINNKEIFLQTECKDFELEKAAIEKYNVTSCFAVPLFYFGDFLGVLAIHYVDKEYSITSEEINLMTNIADQIAIALHQSRLYLESKQKAEKETLLRKMIAIIRETFDLSKIKHEIVTQVGTYLKADRVFFADYDIKSKRYNIPPEGEYRSSDQIESLREVDWISIPGFIENVRNSHLSGLDVIFEDIDKYAEEKGPDAEELTTFFKDKGFVAILAINLNYGELYLGNLVVSYEHKRAFPQEEIDFLKTVADQCSVAVYQARLYKTTQDQAEREIILRKTIEVIRSSIDVDFVKHEMVNQIGKFLKADRVAFADYDFEKGNYFITSSNEYRSSSEVKTFVGYDFAATPGFIEKIREVHLTGKDIVFSDLDKYIEENNLKDSGIEQFYRYMGFSSSLAINIYYGKLFYGNLVVSFEQKRDISEEEINFIKTLADQAGIAIYQSTLYKKEKQSAERETLLRKIFETIRSTLDLKELFELICNELARIFKIQRSFIVEFRKRNSSNEIIIQHEFRAGPEIRGLRDEKFDRRTVEYWGDVLLTNDERIIIDNIPESDTPDYFKETYENIGLKSIMGFPIKQGEDKWGWVGVSEYNYYRHWTEDEVSLLETISSQIYIAIKQAELYKITQQNAQRDLLLRQITERIRSSLDIEETLDFISEETAKLFNLQRAVISSFPDPEDFEKFIVKKEYKSSEDVTGIMQVEDFPKVAAYWGNRLMKENQIFAIDNIDESNTPDYFKNNYKAMGVKSIIGTCIKKGDVAWGVLVLSEYKHYRYWTEEEKTLLKTIASQVYIAINQAELYEKEKLAAEREKLIARVLSEAISTFDMSQIMQIVKEIGVMTKADRCYFVEVDAEKMKGKPINYEGEYLASPDIKSIIGYEFSAEDVRHFIEMFLSAKDLIVFDYVNILKSPDINFEGIKRYVEQFDLKSGIGIPFYYMDKLIAVLAIEYVNENIRPSSDELDFLRILGKQVGMAFSQIQLYQNTKVIAERQSLVARVLSLAIGSFDMSQIKQIVKEIGENTKADRCYFVAVDLERMKGKALDYEGEYLASPDIKSIMGYEFSTEDVALFIQMYLKAKDLIFFDYESILRIQDEKYDGMKRYINECRLKSAIGIPFYHMGKLTAVLAIEYATEKMHPSVEELSFLRILGKQIGMAFSQIQLYQNTKKIAERETLLRQVIETIRSSIDIDQILETICYEVAKIFRVQRATIVEFSDKTDFTTWSIRREYKSRKDIKGLDDVSFDKKAGELNGQIVMQAGQNLVIDNMEESDTPDYYKKTYKDLGVKSMLGLPIKSREDKFGAIFLSSIDEYRNWAVEDVQLLESIASQIYVAIKQAELFENQKKTAERELDLRQTIEISKNQIEALLDSIPYSAWLKDINGKYTAINKGFIDASGKSVNEVIDTTDYEVWPQEFAEKYVEDDALVIKQGTSLCIEEEALFHGEHRWTETCKAPIFDKEGTVVGTAGIARDVTARRQELIELTESRNLIIEANKRQTLLRQITELMRSSLDINEIKKTFVHEIGIHLKADRVAFSDYNPATGSFIISPGNEYKSSEKVKSFIGYDFASIPGFVEGIRDVHLSGKDIIFNDLDKYLEENNLQGSSTANFYRDGGFMSSMAINIFHRGLFYGNLVVTFEEKREITNEEIKIVKTLADQAGIAIYQSTLYEKEKQAAERERLIGKIISKAISTFDMSQIKEIVKDIGIMTKSDRCYFVQFDLERKKAKPVTEDAEYLSSPDIKSIIGYEFPREDIHKFVEMHLRSKDLLVFDYEKILESQDEQYDGMKRYINKFGLKSGIGIPFYYMDKVTALLAIGYVKEKVIPPEDELNFLRILGNQIGIAFSQIQLYQTTKKTAERETLLRKIVETVRSSFDINVVKKNIIEEVGKAFKADRCYFRTYDKANDKFLPVDIEYLSSADVKSIVNVEPDQESLNYYLDEIKKQDHRFAPIVVDEDFVKNISLETYMKEADIKANYGIPIIVGENEPTWLVLHYSKEDPKLDEDYKKLLETIAYQIEIAFNQIKLYNAVKSKADKEVLLRNIIETIRSSLDIDETKQQIVNIIGKTLNADRCMIVEYDKKSDEMSVIKDEYLSSFSILPFKGVDINNLFPNFIKTIKQGKTLLINNGAIFMDTEYQNFDIERQTLEKYNITSSFVVPLFYFDEYLGALVIHYVNKDHIITEDEINLITEVANQIIIAIHQAKLYKTTQMQAEREKISKNIIEILRSTVDMSTIKHLFVQNIGKYFNADRVFFSDYDPQSKMYLPVEASSQYLSSNKEKSFVGYNWSDPSLKEYIQPLLEKRELKIPCWSDYIAVNNRSHGFIARFEDANVKSSYNIPVLYQQEIMGYFCIEFTKNSCNILSNEDIGIIRSMCAQAGIALYHSELFIKAQESSRSKGEFIANISSELKMPLNNLIEFSDVLSNSEFDCAKQVEYLNNINKSSKQLLDLRNDIEVISRIESDNFKLQFEYFDLENLINEIVASIKSDPNNKDVNISIDIINTAVNADKNMLSQILYNLLNTTIRFASAKVNIILKSKLENDRVISFMEISGVGMNTDAQNMIFEKFKQIDFSYPIRQKGVGLELSIVTKLVELQKGYIHVESTDDKGTRVWFVVSTAKRLT